MKEKVRQLYNKGYYIWEIAQELHLTEHEVIEILGNLINH